MTEEKNTRKKRRRREREHPLYALWNSMNLRCYHPISPSYKYYGARGVTVCDRWRASWKDFVSDIEELIGSRPSLSHSLDRIENGKGYEPGNVRWATRIEQARNMRSNRLLTAFGKTQGLSVWAEEIGKPEHVIRKRLQRGWTVEQALTLHDRARLHSSSEYPGVSYNARQQTWRAFIYRDGRQIHLGTFASEADAAQRVRQAKGEEYE